MKPQYLSVEAIEGEGAHEGDLEVRVRILGQSGYLGALIDASSRKDIGDVQAVVRAAGRLVSSVLMEQMAPELSDPDVQEVADAHG